MNFSTKETKMAQSGQKTGTGNSTGRNQPPQRTEVPRQIPGRVDNRTGNVSRTVIPPPNPHRGNDPQKDKK
jgi:hypothetical protein